MAFSVPCSALICALLWKIQLLGAFIKRARIEFSTAIIITPTSANTANQIFAIPRAPKIRTIAFTARDTAMFSRAISMAFSCNRNRTSNF